MSGPPTAPGPAGPEPADDLRHRLDRDGFAVIDVFDRRQVRAIRRALRRFDLAADHGFFASPAHAPGPLARSFQDVVTDIARPALVRVVPGYVPFMVAVTSKGRRRGDAVKFHHDWTYTDERTARPIFLWCPLVDTDAGNGGLSVVPGSHRWTSGIRPSRKLEATESFQEELAARSVPLAVPAGAAIAFDPGLLHGSGPNPTRRARPAITIASAPQGVPLLHFHESVDGSLRGTEVDDRFFTLHPYGTAPPEGAPREPWDRAVSAEDFAAALRNHQGASR